MEGKTNVIWTRQVAEPRHNDLLTRDPIAETQVGQQMLRNTTQNSINRTLQFLRTSSQFKSGKVSGLARFQLEKKASWYRCQTN
jgi:hypothetical protein